MDRDMITYIGLIEILDEVGDTAITKYPPVDFGDEGPLLRGLVERIPDYGEDSLAKRQLCC